MLHKARLLKFEGAVWKWYKPCLNLIHLFSLNLLIKKSLFFSKEMHYLRLLLVIIDIWLFGRPGPSLLFGWVFGLFLWWPWALLRWGLGCWSRGGLTGSWGFWCGGGCRGISCILLTGIIDIFKLFFRYWWSREKTEGECCDVSPIKKPH